MKLDRRIGVCGSGGFIDGHVAAELLRPGHRSLCGMDIVEDIAGIKREGSFCRTDAPDQSG